MTNNKLTDVKRFTKKPVTISAIQWTGDNLPDVIEFTGKHPRWGDWFADMDEYVAHVRGDGNRFKIYTLEGVMDALPGDWIIRGVQGEHYPCKPDIFAATYEPAELQERRKADSEPVSNRYKLDRSAASSREEWLDKLSASWPINHVRKTVEPNNEPTADRLSTLRQHPELITRDEVYSILAIMESEPVAQATLKRLAVILHGSEVDLNLLTVTAQSLVERCKAGSAEHHTHLSELYHAQEKRLFKLAQRIKGQAFDKYSHSPSQAIDVLEAAIFGENEDASRAAMLRAGNSPVTPDGWIKCSDRTPKTGQAVIGCVDFDSDIVTPLVREFIWTGSTFRRGVCSTGVKSNDSVVVTHWMPLPAAPKKD
ncbi:DUF551 domain-containing protein [Salmonella enterica subsp. enterica serovar Chester]|uniref:DUF551 domain-containing protein n=1 Tax=Salmonella enterica TaxID=28901 RepID=UPI003315C5BC